MNITDLNVPLFLYVSFVMIVWFESDIVQTIAKIFNLKSILKIEEFNEYKNNVDLMSTYPEFLYNRYPGYITKLLSCPICLCFWSTLFSIPALLYIMDLPYLIGLAMFPINYISSLIIYLIVKKLL